MEVVVEALRDARRSAAYQMLAPNSGPYDRLIAAAVLAAAERYWRDRLADELEAAAAERHRRLCEIAGTSTDRAYGGTASGMRWGAHVVRTGTDETRWDRVEQAVNIAQREE